MALRKSKIKSSPRLRSSLLPKRGRSTEGDFLELPDGSGFTSRSPRIGLDAMIRFCEANLALFNKMIDSVKSQDKAQP